MSFERADSTTITVTIENAKRSYSFNIATAPL